MNLRHGIQVVEDGLQWSAFVTPVVDLRISEKNRTSSGINHILLNEDPVSRANVSLLVIQM